MKRRQFIKTAAATAALPLMPTGLNAALPVTAAQYAKAVEAASAWAYTTVGNLKQALGVDAATSKLIMNRLQSDGILGATGTNGLALARSFAVPKAHVATRLATSEKPRSMRHVVEKAKDMLMEDAPEAKTPEEDT